MASLAQQGIGAGLEQVGTHLDEFTLGQVEFAVLPGRERLAETANEEPRHRPKRFGGFDSVEGLGLHCEQIPKHSSCLDSLLGEGGMGDRSIEQDSASAGVVGHDTDDGSQAGLDLPAFIGTGFGIRSLERRQGRGHDVVDDVLVDGDDQCVTVVKTLIEIACSETGFGAHGANREHDGGVWGAQQLESCGDQFGSAFGHPVVGVYTSVDARGTFHEHHLDRSVTIRLHICQRTLSDRDCRMAVLAKRSTNLQLRDTWDWLGMGGATANVIMQLGLKPVGYGVAESIVDSGNTLIHPVKRLRTTMTYLAVAVLGTEQEKTAYRLEVDAVHRYVHSTPGAAVRYNAFDPELQLWVAACLYQGFALGQELLRGPLDDADADAIYAEAATLGTTLQVRPEQWPADRDAFQKYWKAGVEAVQIDDFTRTYLWRLVNLEMLPRVLRPRPLVSLSTFLTAGFLTPEFREQMHMTWNDRDQARFDRLFRLTARIAKLQPRFTREFPLNILMWDLRRRSRRGKPLVGVSAPTRQVKSGGCPM